MLIQYVLDYRHLFCVYAEDDLRAGAMQLHPHLLLPSFQSHKASVMFPISILGRVDDALDCNFAVWSLWFEVVLLTGLLRFEIVQLKSKK
jgi:hypothetical protein